MVSLIIHDPKPIEGVNIESKTGNRVDIGSKVVNFVPKLGNLVIIYVKTSRFATAFDHREIAVSRPNGTNFFFKLRRNLRRTRKLGLETLDDKLTSPKSLPMVMMKVQHFLWVSIQLDLRHWQCTHRPHHHSKVDFYMFAGLQPRGLRYEEMASGTQNPNTNPKFSRGSAPGPWYFALVSKCEAVALCAHPNAKAR